MKAVDTLASIQVALGQIETPCRDLLQRAPGSFLTVLAVDIEQLGNGCIVALNGRGQPQANAADPLRQSIADAMRLAPITGNCSSRPSCAAASSSFLAPGSPTGKWANSEVLPLGGDSAGRLPPLKVNARCGPDRRFYCACDFTALLKISVGRGSFYQGTRSDHCGSLSPIHRGGDNRGQRNAKMVRPFRAAIPICSCGGRFFGARYSGAVDCL